MTFISVDPKIDDRTLNRPEHHWEPYVRAEVLQEDGSRESVDGKAHAFTATAHFVKWPDGQGGFHSAWVESEHVTRISREESAWKDPADE